MNLENKNIVFYIIKLVLILQMKILLRLELKHVKFLSL